MRIGIVGSGRYARVHHRHLNALGGISFAVFSPRQESRELFAEETVAKPYSTYSELLSNVDAVTIASPSDTHADYAEIAINSGKHVYIEKPIDLSLHKAISLEESASRSDKAIMVGHTTRFFPMYQHAHSLVTSGKLGKIAAVRLSRRARMVGGASGWFSNHSSSGGALVDLAVHDFDFLLWILGEPESVIACSTAASTGQGDDYALTTIKFRCGAVVHVESEWGENAEPGTAFEICGSDGMIEWNSRNVPSLRTVGVLEQNYLPNDDPFFKALSKWVECATTGADVPIHVSEGIEALKLSMAARESALTGHIVQL
ncbi:MAG: Gfo/Idh/MocA family protein [Fimbriimonas sp.]|jgi:UDP-N-acetylglucosamine 3-dehydrogenase